MGVNVIVDERFHTLLRGTRALHHVLAIVFSPSTCSGIEPPEHSDRLVPKSRSSTRLLARSLVKLFQTEGV
jgi:hypothetical protein